MVHDGGIKSASPVHHHLQGDIQRFHPESKEHSWTSDKIKLSQVIKQGCPLISPLLFNLVLEGVLPHVEKMDSGYEFSNGTKVKILAYVKLLYQREQ